MSGFYLEPLRFNAQYAMDFAKGLSVEELEAELLKLRIPTPGHGEGRTAADFRAGGRQKVEKLDMLLAYMRHHKMATWDPQPLKSALTVRLEAEMAAEVKPKVKMPAALDDLYTQHAMAIARIDALGDEMEQAIADCIAVEGRIRDEAYEHGAGSKDLRLQLDAASIRDTIAKRFRDGKGKAREGTSVASRINLWGLIFSKFKKAA